MKNERGPSARAKVNGHSSMEGLEYGSRQTPTSTEKKNPDPFLSDPFLSLIRCGLTLRVTGCQKLHSEAAQLLADRVDAIVMI